MSDSEESGITYKTVSSPYEDLSDIGSPRADDHELLEPPYMLEDPYAEAALQAPPSPDYVPGPEEPEQAPPSPDYVPGPEHDDDEIVAEDQPTRRVDDDEDPEGIYRLSLMMEEMTETMRWISRRMRMTIWILRLMRRMRMTGEETEPFETDESAATPPPHPAYRMTARITILEPVPVPVWSDFEVARLLAISSPPASPLSPWSSSPPQILFPLPSPSLPLSPPLPVLSALPPSPIRSLGYRATMIRMRAEAAATSHSLLLPPPFILSPTRPNAPPPLPTSAPTSLPPLLLPSASRREDRPEVNLPPEKGLGESSAAAAARPAGGLRAYYGFVATMDREIRRDPERYVGYRITDLWDEIVETLQGAPVSTDIELGAHVREFKSMVRRDTDEIYTMLDDEQSQRQLLAGRGRSMDASDLACAEVMSLRTTVHAQMSEITELQSADRSRQRAILDLLTTDRERREEMRELRGQVTALQGQVMALQGQVTALQGQQGPAGGPTQPELPVVIKKAEKRCDIQSEAYRHHHLLYKGAVENGGELNLNFVQYDNNWRTSSHSALQEKEMKFLSTSWECYVFTPETLKQCR
ncbi:hypothetical protein Tco_1132707 [Tanacetum coccineum]|uniref:Uncharacterized protein n=1 Tax=Tanacetum coccineum TaxID=301880 RepID=A0ABQ5JDT7_9ASTR